MDPRLSISVVVDYMLAETAGGRRAVLKSAKSTLARTYFAPYYGFTRKAVRDYHSGSLTAISEGIAHLRGQLRAPRKPQHAARLVNNFRALTDYNEHFQDIRLQHSNKRFIGLQIRGIVVTCEPTLSGTISIAGRANAANVIVEFGEDEPNRSMSAPERD